MFKKILYGLIILLLLKPNIGLAIQETQKVLMKENEIKFDKNLINVNGIFYIQVREGDNVYWTPSKSKRCFFIDKYTKNYVFKIIVIL